MADEVLHSLPQFFPSIAVDKDGQIQRLYSQDVVPPSLDPATGVQSKDVEIAPGINLSARIYLPPNTNPTIKLPLLFYYHSGCFIIGSAFSPCYHNHLNHLVAQANVVAVSLNYRLAPRIPDPGCVRGFMAFHQMERRGKGGVDQRIRRSEACVFRRRRAKCVEDDEF
ncbi:hypothetical protein SASPL_131387 [Salvia splendens]|uniref:Alpha/beta hydrolase fold-3 domain-containing protein n=1 Tax=Salvia splendens TaxID=180675 RepID=A0A8X8ZK93_SALSN|nr:hypothetical protein SASPL_131387 [Salvia splendens]